MISFLPYDFSIGFELIVDRSGTSSILRVSFGHFVIKFQKVNDSLIFSDQGKNRYLILPSNESKDGLFLFRFRRSRIDVYYVR
jgi:hypothetical protein